MGNPVHFWVFSFWLSINAILFWVFCILTMAKNCDKLSDIKSSLLWFLFRVSEIKISHTHKYLVISIASLCFLITDIKTILTKKFIFNISILTTEKYPSFFQSKKAALDNAQSCHEGGYCCFCNFWKSIIDNFKILSEDRSLEKLYDFRLNDYERTC